MNTKEITFFHLKALIEEVNNYSKRLGAKKNSLSSRIEKSIPSIKKGLEEYNSLVDDVRTDHCSLDADGNMLIREGQKGEDRFMFKPDKLKAMSGEIKKIYDQKVTIDINITGNVPKDITYLQSKYFRGIFIPEDYVYEEPKEEEEVKTEE